MLPQQPLVGGMRPEFLEGYQPVAPQLPEMGIAGRLATDLFAAPGRAVDMTGRGLANIFGQNPDMLDEVMAAPPVKPAPTGTGQAVADFIGEGLMPMAAQIAMTGGIVNPMIPARFPLAQRIATDAAAFGLIGAQHDRATGIEQTLEGAGYGALTGLPRMARIIPAAILALGSKAFFDRDGRETAIPGSDLSVGDVSAIAGFGTAFLPGKVPFRQPLADHFAPVAKPDPLLLNDRGPIEAGYSPRLQLEDRALQGQMIDPDAMRLRGGPGEIGPDGTIFAGGGRELPEVLGLPGGPAPRLALPEMPDVQGRMVDPNQPIPAPYTRPGLWSPQVGQVLTEDMHKWGEQFGIAREQMGQLDDAFVKMGIRENNLKVQMMWDMIRNELRNVEADFNPQKGKVGFPDALLQLDEAQLPLRARMAQMSREELQQLKELEAVKGRIGIPEGELQLLEAAQVERQRRAWQARKLLEELEAAEPFKGKIGIPEAELQLAEMASQERSRARMVHDANAKLLAAVREQVPESMAQQVKGKVVPPEAQIQLDEQAALLRQTQNLEARGQVQQDPSRGKLSQLREWQRSEGGSILPEMLAPMARAGVGGALGYAAGDEEGMLAGIAAGLTPEMLRAFMTFSQKFARPIGAQDNMGAIRNPFKERVLGKQRIISTGIKNPDGTIATGEAWNSPHKEAIRDHLLQGGDPTTDVILDNMGFLVEDANARIRFATREEALPIARAAGQLAQEPTNGRLASELLRDPVTAPRSYQDVARSVGNDPQLRAKDVQPAIMLSTGEILRTPGARLHADIEVPSGKEGQVVDYGFQVGDNYIRRNDLTKALDDDSAVGMDSMRIHVDPEKPINLSGLRPLQNKQGGFLFDDLRAAMSRATLGALVGGGIGGATNGNEGFLMGGLLGVGAAVGGPSVARKLIEGMSNVKVTPPSGKGTARDWVNLAKNFGQTFRDKSGSAYMSGATASDRFVRWLDQNLGITAPNVLKEALMSSKGAASAMLDTLDTALLKTGFYNPDEGLKKLSNQFLDGNIDSNAYLKEVANRYPGTESENYAKLITTSREVVNGLQKMVKDGVGDPKMAKVIEDSIGHYLTRSYKLFTDKNWNPTQESIDKLVQELKTKKVYGDATVEDLHTMVAQYVREVKATKGVYKMGEGKIGQEVSQQVLKRRKDLSDAWKEFLGEITDPTERVYQTVFRIRPMAEASNYFSKLVNGVKEDGWLPHAFQNYNELFAFEQNLKSQADHFATVAKDSPQHIEAQKKLEKFQEAWKGQQNVENHPKFGSLRGRVVTRHVWDTLATYDNLTDNVKSPWLRGMMSAHTAIKLGRTALNPITVVRNFMTAPMFAAIGRATPHDITEAWHVVMNADHPLRREIMEQGIGNVDQVKTEFYKEFENLTGGKYNFGEVDLSSLNMGKLDFNLAEKIGKRGFRHILDAYRLPDNLVRIGSYLSAKSRIAEALGKSLDDPDVIAQAARFTNRYTMNYDAVSPIVKKMRQLPFFNLFITYTAEMTRILKNLSEDVLKGNSIDGVVDHTRHGRAYAAVPLGALAVLPELIQSSSEDSLSPQDKAEWDKAKKLMPDYARTRYKFGIKKNKQTGQFEYQDFTPLIASDSLNQLVKAVATGDLEAAKSVNPLLGWENTPLWNIAREQTVGEDMRTGRKFRGKLGEFRNTADRLATVAREALPPWFPPAGSEWQKLVQATSTNAEGTQGITNLRTGVRLTPQDFLQPYLTGVRGGTVNPDTLETRAINEIKREMANETAYLNDVLNSDLPDAKKNQAMETFRIVVEELRESLRQRLETPSDRK